MKGQEMRILAAMVSGLLIGLAASPLMASDYEITVKLQDFSNPDGVQINPNQGAPDPEVLAKLIPGDVLFLHRVILPAGGSVKEDVQMEKTEARVSYRLGEEKDGKISVTVAVNITKVLRVKDGVPIKSTQSMNTAIDCPIGQEMCLSVLQETQMSETRNGLQQEKKTHRVFTISVTK